MTEQRSWSLDPARRVHLVGIGGAGMSALARILLERRFTVTGSDLRGGRAAAALVAMGASVSVGHARANAAGASLVVASTAVPADNPELVGAREAGVPVIRRAELLAALMDGYRRILVAGTHGKTTTTSMATVALQAAGLDPSFAIGGMIHESGTSAHHGTGDVFVAEADESDRSFLSYEPDCAIVTNVELDHHDVYADLDDVLAAFSDFAGRRTGPAVLCRDDDGAELLRERLTGEVRTYGVHPDADLRITELALDPDRSACLLVLDGEPLGRLELRVPGSHNLLNATAATAAALWAGAGFDDVVSGLAVFGGAQRRFQRVGEEGGVVVVDDYAHHPTELVATIAAARQTSGRGRVVAVFQPHRYSRTAALGTDLGTALAGADLAVVTDVYGAGEAPEPGVTGTLVADAARAAGVATEYVPSISDVPAHVAGIVGEGDLVVTMGAGDVTEIGPLLLASLRTHGGTRG